MSAIDELVANNRAHAKTRAGAMTSPGADARVGAGAGAEARAGAGPGAAPGDQNEARPTRAIAVVTCMDARIDPAAALGLEPGEAHVLRNAGAAVTDDVIRSLAISQRLLGTREVMVIGHTLCGMQGLDEHELTAELAAKAGVTPAWAIESFADLDDGVRGSVERVRQSPFLEHRDRVRGFVYDVRTGGLREVR